MPAAMAAEEADSQSAPHAIGGRSGARPRCPSTGTKKVNNLVVRSVTILSLGPLLFICAMHSKELCTLLIFLGVFIAGIEWTGLKRHLKVALLLGEGSGDDGVEGQAAVASGIGHAEVPDGVADAAGHPLLTPSLPSSPLLPSGEPLRPEEYALPVPPVTLYAVLKHVGWAGLAVSAYVSVNAYVVTLAAYFLVFVCVTVMAHNHLEMKVEKATTVLSRLEPGSGGEGEAGRKGGSSDRAHTSRETGRAGADAAGGALKKAQREYFLSLELRMIADKQPTEQFLDFCLDIFGILWISGLVFPIFLYSMPRVGLPWGFATLLGNFCNDITALVVGRSLKAVRQHYAAVYDLPHVSPSVTASTPGGAEEGKRRPKAKESDGDEADERGPKLRPVAEAGPLLRLILRGPHPLYPAISPNKSAEGAVAGAFMNALVFSASMSVCYTYVTPLPEPHYIAHGFHCKSLWLLVGLVMGILGVVGDLLQSLLKRAARVKDAGFIVPGHGGILDRLDGCLLVFPFMFCVMSALHALSQ